MHKSRKIATHFDTKIKAFTTIYNKVGYTRHTIKSDLKFEINLEILYCQQIEIPSKIFVTSFAQFTDEKHRIAVKKSAKKVESLFPLKDHNLHPCCKIYKEICSRGNT